MRYLKANKNQRRYTTIVFRARNESTKIQSTSLELSKAWLIYLQVNLQQIKFDNVFRI